MINAAMSFKLLSHKNYWIDELRIKDKWFLWRFITTKVLQRQGWINFTFADV